MCFLKYHCCGWLAAGTAALGRCELFCGLHMANERKASVLGYQVQSVRGKDKKNELAWSVVKGKVREKLTKICFYPLIYLSALGVAKGTGGSNL